MKVDAAHLFVHVNKVPSDVVDLVGVKFKIPIIYLFINLFFLLFIYLLLFFIFLFFLSAKEIQRNCAFRFLRLTKRGFR